MRLFRPSLGVVLALTLSSAVAQAGAWQEIKDFFSEAVQENDLKIDIISKSKDFGNGFKGAIKIGEEIEPSYIDNKSLITNKWKIEFNQKGADLFGFKESSKVFFDAGIRGEVEMSRFFDDNNDALRYGLNLYKNSELNILNFPYNSKNAKEMHKNGSAVFTANFNVGLGLANRNISETLNSYINLSYAARRWGGAFKYYIYKYPKGSCFYDDAVGQSQNCRNSDRIRLVLVGLRSKVKHEVKGDLEYMDLLDITGNHYINKQLSRALGIDELVLLQQGASDKDLFVADYVLDLSNEEVSKAYDKFMAQEFRPWSWTQFQSILIANPFVDFNEIRKIMLDTVKPLEELVASIGDGDLDRPIYERAAYRRDSASDKASDSYKKCGLNLLIYSYECDKRTTNSHIVYVDESGNLNRVNNARKDSKSEHMIIDLLNLKRVKEIKREFVGLVLKEDEGYVPAKLLYLTSQYLYNDDRFTKKRNLLGTKKDILRIVPIELHSILESLPQWKAWYAHNTESKKKASIKLQVYLNEESIGYFPQKTADEFEQSFNAFLDKESRTELSPTADPTFWSTGAMGRTGYKSSRTVRTKSSKYKKDVETIARNLSIVADRSKLASERRDKFFELSNNALFSQVGLSYLVSVVFEQVNFVNGSDSDKLRELVYIELKMSSEKFRGDKEVRWTFGNPIYLEKQKKLNHYQALLYDSKYFLRDPNTLD